MEAAVGSPVGAPVGDGVKHEGTVTLLHDESAAKAAVLNLAVKPVEEVDSNRVHRVLVQLDRVAACSWYQLSASSGIITPVWSHTCVGELECTSSEEIEEPRPSATADSNAARMLSLNEKSSLKTMF